MTLKSPVTIVTKTEAVAFLEFQEALRLMSQKMAMSIPFKYAHAAPAWTYGTILRPKARRSRGALRVMFLAYMKEPLYGGRTAFRGITVKGDKMAELARRIGRIDQFPTSEWEPDE